MHWGPANFPFPELPTISIAPISDMLLAVVRITHLVLEHVVVVIFSIFIDQLDVCLSFSAGERSIHLIGVETITYTRRLPVTLLCTTGLNSDIDCILIHLDFLLRI